MVRPIAAKCPSCGAGVDVDPESEWHVCAYCTTRVYVETAARRKAPDHPPPTVPVIRVDAVHKAAGKVIWIVAISTLLPVLVGGAICAVVPAKIASTVTTVAESANRAVEESRAAVPALPARAAVNYFADATAVPKTFAARIGGPLMATQLVLYPTYGFLEVQDPKVPRNVDRYPLRDGVVGEPEPQRLIGHKKNDLARSLFDLEKLDFSLVPKMIADAKARLGYEGGEASHIILERGIPFHPDIVWRIYVSGPRDSGRVEYDPSGRMTKVYR